MKLLAELTWPEARDEQRAGALVLIPIGATEAHGPHLPLGTDVYLSEELARRAARVIEQSGARVIIAPSISYSVAEYASEFSGTVSISNSAAVQVLADACVSLMKQGFEQICLVNNHLEPAHVESLNAAAAAVEARTGRKIAFPDQTVRRWARTLTEEYKRGACHAGQYETSLLLAARPDLVRDSIRAQLAPKPIDLAVAMKSGIKTFVAAGADQAYFGTPAQATAEEGDAIYHTLVTMVVETIKETFVITSS